MKIIFTLSKAGILFFWSIFLYNLARPLNEPYNDYVLWFGLALLLIHVIEFFAMRKKLLAHGAADLNGFIQTLLFGLFYWLPILRK